MRRSTQQKWNGRWEQLTGEVEEIWAELTDDEFLQADGDYERLVGLIEERTGETREEIEEALENKL